MALTRKFLSALGIEADKVDEIIEAHTDTVNVLKAERDELKKGSADATELQAKVEELTKELETAGKDGFKDKYDELKKEFDAYKADTEQKALNATKEQAYRKLLKDTGVSEKRIDAIMKLTDLSEVELDGDGLKDATKLADAIKTEWADFITSTGKEGAGTEQPPKSGDDSARKVNVPTFF